MSSQPNIVHILYSGVGGEAGVFFPLARAGRTQATQHAIFYGIEPMAEANRLECALIGIPWLAVHKQPGLDRNAQKAITNYLLKVKPSAVIVHTLSTLPACLKAKRELPALRIIAVEHHANAMKSAKRWLLSLTALWRADAVVYLTETYRQEVLRKLSILATIHDKKTRVIGNSLDLDQYPANNTHSLGTIPVEALPPARPFTFGMQGRMVEGKDFGTLLRALAIANQQNDSPMHLEFAGDGPLRASLESLTDELNLRAQVRFLGLLSKADLIARMASWDAYAHASDGETMSISIMEAKACGLPMVVSDVPGISNFFTHEHNGLLVPARSAPGFAEALLRLRNDPALRQHLSVRARQEAEENFSSRQAWQAFAALIFPSAPSHSAALASQIKQQPA